MGTIINAQWIPRLEPDGRITEAHQTNIGVIPKDYVLREAASGLLEATHIPDYDYLKDKVRHIDKDNVTTWEDINHYDGLNAALREELNSLYPENYRVYWDDGWFRFRNYYLRYKEESTTTDIVEANSNDIRNKVAEMASKFSSFDKFLTALKAGVGENFGFDYQSESFIAAFDMKEGDRNAGHHDFNIQQIKKFYDTQGKEYKAAQKREREQAAAQIAVDNIIHMALAADAEFSPAEFTQDNASQSPTAPDSDPRQDIKTLIKNLKEFGKPMSEKVLEDGTPVADIREEGRPIMPPPASPESLWVNDNYYTQNPHHIHDEFFTKSGRYGEVKSVRSTSLNESLSRIDTGGVELPRRTGNRRSSSRLTSSDGRGAVSTGAVSTGARPTPTAPDPLERALARSGVELEAKATAKKKRSQRAGSPPRPRWIMPDRDDAAQRNAEERQVNPIDELAYADVPMFTAEEVAATYNEGLTEDDFRIFAYYWQQQGQPLEGYYASLPAPNEDELIGWIEQGRLYYYRGMLLPDYFYLAEDIYEKETVFQQERTLITNKYGEAVAARQQQALSNVFQSHYRGRLLLDHTLPETERLVIDPESSFAYQFKVKGLVSAESFHIRKVTAEKNKRFGEPDFIKDANSYDTDRTTFEELSLTQAYHYWLTKNARTISFKKPVDSIELIKIGSYRTPRPQDTDATVWSTKKANVQSEYKRLFAEFLSTELLPEDRTQLETKWNREYNNYLPIDYTRVPVAFPMGKTYRDMPVDIRSEKRDAVTFMLSQGSGCLAYDVGFGKTWSAIFIISQMLHIGRCRRPLLVVPNQVYKQFLLEIKGLAPHIPIREYYNLDQEHLEYARNFPPQDGSLTIMTYEGLRKLGFNQETSREYMRELIEITQQGFDKVTTKKQQAIQEGVLERIGQMLTGSQVNIEDFGWDFLCVDEAHSMKKIFTSVKGEVINGDRQVNSYEIQSGSPSTLGLKGFAVANYILRRNSLRNVLLLTATPFTNSPLEVYSMLTLVGYDSLVKRGIKSIKQFFDTYVDTDYRLVINAQLQPERRQVVTGFRNLKSLQSLIYRSFDRKDINTKNAKGQGVSVKRPEKWVLPLRSQLIDGHDGHRQWVYVEQDERVESILPLTDYQAEIMADVKSYASGHKEFNLLCNRFLEMEVAGDLEEGTIVEVAERLFEHSLNEKEQAGVRLLRAMSLSRNLALSPYLHVCRNLPPLTYKSYIETSPKLLYVMECVKSVRQHHLDRNEPVSGQVIYMDRGVDYFALIKEYLVKELGYEPHEVGIMRSNMSSVKPKGVATGEAKSYVQNLFLGKKWIESRKEFVDVPDAERIKIIIGTGTIKEGVNLQRFGTVLYNCFIDWNPTDQIQLEGRIWRQGNLYKNVRIVNVLMEDSADIFLFQKLEEKTGRINQLWNRDGSSNTFNLDEFNPEELKYTLISDPAVIAKLEIEEEEARIREGKLSLENDIKQIIAVQEAFRDRDTYVDRLLPYLQDQNLRVPADRRQDTEYMRAKLATIIRSQTLPMNGDLEDTNVERVSVKEYFLEGAGRDTRSPQYSAQRQFKPDWWSSYARALRLVKRFEDTYLKPRGWHPDRLDSERKRIQDKIAELEQQITELSSEESKRARRLRIEMEREESRQISKNLEARVEDFKSLNYLLDDRKEVVMEAKNEAPGAEQIEQALEGLRVLADLSEGDTLEEVNQAVNGLEVLLELAA